MRGVERQAHAAAPRITDGAERLSPLPYHVHTAEEKVAVRPAIDPQPGRIEHPQLGRRESSLDAQQSIFEVKARRRDGVLERHVQRDQVRDDLQYRASDALGAA